MKVNWENLPKLLLPLILGFILAFIISDYLELSLYTSVPVALFIMVQLQKQGLI